MLIKNPIAPEKLFFRKEQKEKLFSISDTLDTKEIHLCGLHSHPKKRIFLKVETVEQLNN